MKQSSKDTIQTNSTAILSAPPVPDWLNLAIAEAIQEAIANPIQVQLRTPHDLQRGFIESPAKRIVIRAGRRGGKTVGIAIKAVKQFIEGRRVLYAAPTQEQVDRFWYEVKQSLNIPLESGALYKNETAHLIEVPRSLQRIRAKTAWNADTLRGDYADLLILDEWQLMNEDAWELVGAPMLLDNNGDAVFIYTPPSVRSIGMSKARNKRHAAELYQKALLDQSGRWAVFHFGSKDNPHISAEALEEISRDMSALAYRQEILAEDVEDIPGTLWKQSQIDKLRIDTCPPLAQIVIPIDPSATSRDSSDEAGIVPVGKAMCSCKGKPEMHGFVLADYTLRGTPNQWANRAIDAYEQFKANRIIGEGNNGGEMIETVIRYAAQARGLAIPYSMVYASRGKETRAEPVSALYEQGRIHHIGVLAALENEQTTWIPGTGRSPNRVDSLVWGITELRLQSGSFFK